LKAVEALTKRKTETNSGQRSKSKSGSFSSEDLLRAGRTKEKPKEKKESGGYSAFVSSDIAFSMFALNLGANSFAVDLKNGRGLIVPLRDRPVPLAPSSSGAA
jgi:hypothetical protein